MFCHPGKAGAPFVPTQVRRVTPFVAHPGTVGDPFRPQRARDGQKSRRFGHPI